MFKLETEIKFDSIEQAKNFHDSIKPELGEEFSRSKTHIKRNGEKLDVKINASDRGAMRASLNSVMKPLDLYMQLEAIK